MLSSTLPLFDHDDDFFSSELCGAQVEPVDNFDAGFWPPSPSMSASSTSSPLSNAYVLSSPSAELHPPTVIASTVSAPVSSPTVVVASAVVCSDAKSLRRLKHRTLDAQRRTRESAAVDKLTTLVTGNKRDRASVLESAASVINELQTALAQKEKQLAAATELASARKRVRTSGALAHRKLRESDTMQRSAFFACVFASSSVLQLIFNADSGVLLFVTSSLAGFGEIASQLIGQQCWAPRSDWLVREPEHIDNDWYCRQLNVKIRGEPVKMCEANTEYKRAISKLYRGEIEASDTEFYAPTTTDVPTRMRAKLWMSSIAEKQTNVHLLHVIAQEM